MPTQDSKLKRLENLLRAVDDTVTKEEFKGAFELVLKVVKEIKETNIKEFGLIHQFMTQFQGKLQGDTSMTLADMKKQVDGLFVSDRVKKMEDSHMQMMSKMEAKMASMKNGKDGTMGVPGKHGLDGRTPTADELRAIMEPLIPKVDDIVKKIPQRVQTPAKSYQIRKVDLTSQCDGSNKTFNVGGTHFGIMGVFGTQFPQIYRPIIDYTETKTGFTLTGEVGAPQTGQTLVCQFLK